MNFLNNPDHPVTLLGFGTLLAGLIIALVLLGLFLRNRRHRHPMQGQRERNIDEIRAEGRDGGA
jgi:hypothetical protein